MHIPTASYIPSLRIWKDKLRHHLKKQALTWYKHGLKGMSTTVLTTTLTTRLGLWSSVWPIQRRCLSKCTVNNSIMWFGGIKPYMFRNSNVIITSYSYIPFKSEPDWDEALNCILNALKIISCNFSLPELYILYPWSSAWIPWWEAVVRSPWWLWFTPPALWCEEMWWWSFHKFELEWCTRLGGVGEWPLRVGLILNGLIGMSIFMINIVIYSGL